MQNITCCEFVCVINFYSLSREQGALNEVKRGWGKSFSFLFPLSTERSYLSKFISHLSLKHLLIFCFRTAASVINLKETFVKILIFQCRDQQSRIQELHTFLFHDDSFAIITLWWRNGTGSHIETSHRLSINDKGRLQQGLVHLAHFCVDNEL